MGSTASLKTASLKVVLSVRTVKRSPVSDNTF